jgi:trehalose 6-phosphate phosphatase
MHLGPLARRLAASRALYVASDFDGTLAPIATHPDQARLPERTRRAIVRLRDLPGARVAVISGRGLGDLRRQIRIDGVWLAGSSGLETTGRDGPRIEIPAAHRVPAELTAELADWCRRFPGSWLEDKGVAFSAHYRAVPEKLQPSFGAGLRRRVRPFARAARLVAGKKVFEILPALARDKSHALDRWLPRRPKRAVIFFFGDDANDEPLHRRVRRLRGIAVAVGRVRSRAEFVVPGPTDVAWFLEWLGREWSALRGAAPR